MGWPKFAAAREPPKRSPAPASPGIPVLSSVQNWVPVPVRPAGEPWNT